ncbi:hypothetical protein JCM8202_003687 [Rhodotorula sphaerocarpa]
MKKIAARRAAAAAASAAAGDPSSSSAAQNGGSSKGPQLECRAQQSRFWTDTLTSGVEIDVKDVTISIGERELLSNAHVRLKEGVRYGLVGRNGTGKSTLFKALAKKLIPGINPSTRILLLSQVEDTVRAAEKVNSDLSVLDHVVRGDKELLAANERHRALTAAVESNSVAETARIVRTLELEDRRHDLVQAQLLALRRSGTRGKAARDEEIKAEAAVQEAEDRLAHVGTDADAECVALASDMLQANQTTLDLLEHSTATARAAEILVGLGFTREMYEGPFRALSGGWRSRCSLATSLLVQSDILLLDEVTNFLDLEATIWLEHYLRAESRTLVVISHDIAFLNNVVEETIVLRNQTLRYFEGTPAAFEVHEKKEYLRSTSDQAALDKKRAHIETSIRKGKASAKATSDENRSRMVKSREKKLEERWGAETSAKGTRFKLNRDMAGFHLDRRGAIEIEAPERQVKIKLEDPPPLRTLGDLGGRIAFVGQNGNGKSTLAKLIVGELQPTKGSIVRHPLAKIGYFSQHSVEDLSQPLATLSLDRPLTALSYFLERFPVEEQAARAFLGSFGLGGKLASDAPISHLSGGQKVRLAFALLVFELPSLLLLDEVTTHVDSATVQALARALRDWSGAVVLITHDRWLSRVVVEGESVRRASGMDDEEDSDAVESSDDELGGGAGAGRKPGLTWKVGKGKIKLMEKGMEGYVASVERKVARRERLQGGST